MADHDGRGAAWWLTLVACVAVAGGTAIGGYLAGRGVLLSRLQDRYVTVKGVAEVELKADLAIMPLRFTLTAGDVRDGQAQIEATTRTVVEFLKARGFQDVEIGRASCRERV